MNDTLLQEALVEYFAYTRRDDIVCSLLETLQESGHIIEKNSQLSRRLIYSAVVTKITDATTSDEWASAATYFENLATGGGEHELDCGSVHFLMLKRVKRQAVLAGLNAEQTGSGAALTPAAFVKLVNETFPAERPPRGASEMATRIQRHYEREREVLLECLTKGKGRAKKFKPNALAVLVDDNPPASVREDAAGMLLQDEDDELGPTRLHMMLALFEQHSQDGQPLQEELQGEVAAAARAHSRELELVAQAAAAMQEKGGASAGAGARSQGPETQGPDVGDEDQAPESEEEEEEEESAGEEEESAGEEESEASAPEESESEAESESEDEPTPAPRKPRKPRKQQPAPASPSSSSSDEEEEEEGRGAVKAQVKKLRASKKSLKAAVHDPLGDVLDDTAKADRRLDSRHPSATKVGFDSQVGDEEDTSDEEAPTPPRGRAGKAAKKAKKAAKKATGKRRNSSRERHHAVDLLADDQPVEDIEEDASDDEDDAVTKRSRKAEAEDDDWSSSDAEEEDDDDLDSDPGADKVSAAVAAEEQVVRTVRKRARKGGKGGGSGSGSGSGAPAAKRVKSGHERQHTYTQRRRWTNEEEQVLRKAVMRMGAGNWAGIQAKYGHRFQDRSAVDIKDKWRNIKKKEERMMKAQEGGDY